MFPLNIFKVSVIVAPKLTFFCTKKHYMHLSFPGMETVHTIDPSCPLGMFYILYWEEQAEASCNI